MSGYSCKSSSDLGGSHNTNHEAKSNDFDDFLKEEGIFEECNAAATKAVIAMELKAFMDNNKITKVEMAKRLQSSRSVLDRLLDPKNDSITLLTIEKVASVLGKKVVLAFE